MKNLGIVFMVFVALVISMPSGISQNAKVKKIPFQSNFEKLSYYLDLAAWQREEIYGINEFFIEQQKRYLIRSSSLDTKRKNLHQILYTNLSMMKKALTEDQYRKYVILINITNNNKLVNEKSSLSDVYLTLLSDEAAI